MITIETKKFFLKKKTIWFAETPFDVDDCDAVFFLACKKDVDAFGFKKHESPTIIFNLQKNLDELWGNVGKRTRRYIKHAKKNGVTLEVNKNYEQFHNMYIRFVQKKNFKAFPFDTQSMQKIGTLFTAVFDRKILSGILTVEDHNRIRALLGGSVRFETDDKTARLVSSANRFIIWKIIKYAKDKGYKTFDFGGYYGKKNQEDPRVTIDYFKRQFGGTIVTYYNYEKYYSKIYAVIKTVLK